MNERAGRLPRRALVAGVLGATATGQLVGCAAVSNPAVAGFLRTLAEQLVVSATIDIGKQAATYVGENWSSVVSTVSHRDEWAYSRIGYARKDVAPVVLLALWPSTQASNPMEAQVVALLRQGKGILLEAWAWQTLTMFAEKFLSGRGGADLEEAKQLLGYALTPAKPRSKKFQTDGKLAAGVTYYAANGSYVEIVKIEESDHSFTGRIKVSGIPDASGVARIETFKLPAENWSA